MDSIEGNKIIADVEDCGYEIKPNGDVYVHRKMKLSVGNAGYRMVNIFGNGNRKYKTHSVHRLVAMKYLPNPDSLSEVNHKDGDKLNNNISNLEWVSRSENINHAFKTGLNKGAWKGKFGENHIRSKNYNQNK